MPAYILITVENRSMVDSIYRQVIDLEEVTVAETTQPGTDWEITAKLFAAPDTVMLANDKIRKIPGVISTAVAFRRATRQKKRR